jgi:hypothetical protein
MRVKGDGGAREPKHGRREREEREGETLAHSSRPLPFSYSRTESAFYASCSPAASDVFVSSSARETRGNGVHAPMTFSSSWFSILLLSSTAPPWSPRRARRAQAPEGTSTSRVGAKRVRSESTELSRKQCGAPSAERRPAVRGRADAPPAALLVPPDASAARRTLLPAVLGRHAGQAWSGKVSQLFSVRATQAL